MIIAIDFDGTCVTHEYPKVGQDIGAIPVLKKLVENGHLLILYTMRCNKENEHYLDDAIEWFVKNEIPLYGIQTNPTQKEWTLSNKCYAQLYIDDASLGCPLTFKYKDLVSISRPFVNWEIVEEILRDKKLI